MDIITTIKDMQHRADDLRRRGLRIGCVPTMGFLHEGHLSLIRRARELTDVVVMSNFVNPTQFAPNEDFAAYPRDLARDNALAEAAGCSIVFAPDAADMYPDGFRTRVVVTGLTRMLEGEFRPTHFDGVTTVVAKLFHAMKPHVAVFGQKDAQQAVVIRRMVRDLDFDIDVVVAPTVREADGVAMSSRNTYLSPEERVEARAISHSLRQVEDAVRAGERSVSALMDLLRSGITRTGFLVPDYTDIVDADALMRLERLPDAGTALVVVAVRCGRTRLIDNIIIHTGDAQDA